MSWFFTTTKFGCVVSSAAAKFDCVFWLCRGFFPLLQSLTVSWLLAAAKFGCVVVFRLLQSLAMPWFWLLQSLTVSWFFWLLQSLAESWF